MAAVDASNRGVPIQPFAEPSPVAPARIGPGGIAPHQKVPAAPREHRRAPPLAPDEAAKAAVNEVHTLRAELHALIKATPPSPPERIEEKRQALVTHEKSAVVLAKKNLEIWDSKEREARDVAIVKLVAWRDAKLKGPIGTAKAHDDYTEAAAAHDKIMPELLEARKLLDEAKGTPQENLTAALDNLSIAQRRKSAAEVKLGDAEAKLATIDNQSPAHKKSTAAQTAHAVHAAQVARMELETAEGRVADAESEVTWAKAAAVDAAKQDGK